MKPDYKQLKDDISFEHGQIDVVVSKIGDLKNSKTDIATAAIASYLMNFYNGIENIMKRCAKEYYKKIPKGDDWHKQLLQQSCLYNNNKIALFNKKTIDKERSCCAEASIGSSIG